MSGESEVAPMQRRKFLQSLAATAAAAFARPLPAFGALPKMKITRIRAFKPPRSAPGFNQIFNQSYVVVTVETDAGITGIGEGGSKDLLAPGASRLIGREPQYFEQLWQDMNRAYFYRAGRERTDANGALDLALWDIRGKALKVPVHELLGGKVRNYCECYNTAGMIPGVTRDTPMKERARLTMEAGYHVFRFDALSVPINTTYDVRERINKMHAFCAEAREGVGPDGN